MFKAELLFLVREDLQALDQHYFSLTVSIMIYLLILRHPHLPFIYFWEKYHIRLNIKAHPSHIVLSTHSEVH